MEPNPEQGLTKKQIAKNESRATQDSLRHVLCFSQETLLRNENREAFEALRLSLYQEYEPETITEILFLERIVAYDWRLKRIQRMEKQILESSTEPKVSGLTPLRRYEASLKRGMNQSIKFLDQQRKLHLQQTRCSNNPAKISWRELLQVELETLNPNLVTPPSEPSDDELTESINRLWENTYRNSRP